MNRREASAVMVALLFLCRPGGAEEEETKCMLQRIIAGQERIFDMINDVQERLNKVEANQEALRKFEQCSTEEQLAEFHSQMAIDECSTRVHNCSERATCIDRLIGHTCVCNEGYDGDGYTCHDVNECYLGTAKCHPSASCINTIGSYFCKCPPWYDGDGFVCEAPGCKPPSQVVQGLGCVIPVTKKTTWAISRKYCKKLGARLIEGVTPETLIPLKKHFQDVLEGWLVWIGVRNSRWVTGQLPITPKTMWRSDEPDGGPEQCGWITLWPVKPYFGDAYCNNISPSMCQRIYR